MEERLRLIGVTKDAVTAGPGKRFELFTKGCIRGVINPCEGCFNEDTWTFEGKYRDMSSEELVEIIKEDAWNRQVTFCGGEPMLQARALTQVAKRLKEIDPTFHIIMYTAYKLDTLMKYGLNFTWVKEKHGEGMKDALNSYSDNAEILSYNAELEETVKSKYAIATAGQIKELMKYVDIIVDGDYKHKLRIPTAKYMNDGQFIGSNNQRLIDCQETLEKGQLVYKSPEEYNDYLNSALRCKCCGHAIEVVDIQHEGFCHVACRMRYEKRDEVMKDFGGA